MNCLTFKGSPSPSGIVKYMGIVFYRLDRLVVNKALLGSFSNMEMKYFDRT